MINNAYEILGLTSNASDDDVKKAYRDLSRKYHPDSYSDNPLAGLAEEKFKEVQEAYEQIMAERSGGYQSSNGYRGNASGGPVDAELQSVYLNINARRFQEAISILNRMSNRPSMWYYLSAAANTGIGNNILAHEHAAQAVNMEPNNAEYRQLLNQLDWNSQRYQRNPYNGTGGNSSCGTGNLCCDLWCADSLCECMGGDICSCM